MAETEQRNWAELPNNVLYTIFLKLGFFEILLTAQLVCKSWRDLSFEPDLWRRIDMRYKTSHFTPFFDREKLALQAISRSRGKVEEFYAEYLGTTNLIKQLICSGNHLRCFALVSSNRGASCNHVYDKSMIALVRGCPMLEELCIVDTWYISNVYGEVGRARPELKRFRLTTRDVTFSHCPGSSPGWEALEIANNMPQLRELQLIGNDICKKGLHAILDKCRHLESLDIRGCHNFCMDAALKDKLARIKTVQLPFENPTVDYNITVTVAGVVEPLSCKFFSWSNVEPRRPPFFIGTYM